MNAQNATYNVNIYKVDIYKNGKSLETWEYKDDDEVRYDELVETHLNGELEKHNEDNNNTVHILSVPNNHYVLFGITATDDDNDDDIEMNEISTHEKIPTVLLNKKTKVYMENSRYRLEYMITPMYLL